MCAQSIVSDGISIRGTPIHRVCASCAICHKPYDNDDKDLYPSQVSIGRLYCRRHVMNPSECCASCGEPLALTQQTHRNDGRPVHTSCFTSSSVASSTSSPPPPPRGDLPTCGVCRFAIGVAQLAVKVGPVASTYATQERESAVQSRTLGIMDCPYLHGYSTP